MAANANVAAPIDAAVGANILSDGSTAQAWSDQGVMIDQSIEADATATAVQDSGIDQSDDTVGTEPAETSDDTASVDGAGLTAPTEIPTDVSDVGETAGSTLGSLDGNLLNVDVNLDVDADVAAPINGAVAANANVAAPIDAAVAANIASVDSDAVAVAQQDAIINQDVTGSAEATSDQSSEIKQ